MAESAGTIVVRVVTDDRASAGLKRIQGNLSRLGKGAEGGGLKKLVGGLGQLEQGFSRGEASGLGMLEAVGGVGAGALAAAAGVAAVVGGLFAFTAAGNKANIQADQFRLQIRALTASADEADAAFTALDDFADTTLFDDKQVFSAGRALLAAGMAAKDLVPTLEILQAASGQNGETFAALSDSFATLSSRSVATSKNLISLQQAGKIDVFGILAEQMGKSREEIKGLAAGGKLLTKQVLPMILRGIGETTKGLNDEMRQSLPFLESEFGNAAEDASTAWSKGLEPISKSIYGGLGQSFRALEASLKNAFSDPKVQEFVAALGEALMAIGDVLGSILPLFGDVARVLIDFLTPALRLVAPLFRTLAEAIRAVVQFLKPLWDFMRAVAQQIKAILGYLFPLVAAFFRLGKGGDDAGGAMSRFLSSINPFGPNLDLATRAVIALADAIAVFVLYKAITITVSVVSAAAALALTALTTLLTLINAGATALVTAVTTVANVAIAITHAALRAIERTYFAVISVSVVLGAGLALAGIGIGLAGLKESYDVLVSASADTKAADDSMDALKERLTSLREPATPWTFTITGITEDALSVLDTLRLRILEIVSPNAPWQFEVFGIVAGALAELGKLMEALRFVPEAVTIGFGVDFGGIEAGIKSVVDALASIPRMITTVVRTVSGDSAIADSTGPNSSGLSVPPAAAGAGGITMNAVLGAAAVAVAAIAATIVQAVAGGRRGFACFTADTSVWTSHGLARIADIVPGDIVEVYDPETGTVVMSAVADTLVHPDHPVWHLRINGDAISTTAEHPFLTPSGWRRADELRAGSHVVTATHHEVVEESHDAGRIATVYNIHVDHPAHTYLVGTARWVVHNFKTVGAEGAIVNRATMALIGEKGPEALVPLNQTAGNGPLSGLGGVTVNGLTINVSGFADPVAAGASAADAFRRQLGLQRRLPFGTA